MKKVFDAKVLREYRMPDGSIMHGEVQIEDSVIMKLWNLQKKMKRILIKGNFQGFCWIYMVSGDSVKNHVNIKTELAGIYPL